MAKMIKLIKDKEVCYFTTDKISAMFEPDKLNPEKNSHHVIMIIGCPAQILSEEAYDTILGAWCADQPYPSKDDDKIKIVSSITHIIREPFLRKS